MVQRVLLNAAYCSSVLRACQRGQAGVRLRLRQRCMRICSSACTWRLVHAPGAWCAKQHSLVKATALKQLWW